MDKTKSLLITASIACGAFALVTLAAPAEAGRLRVPAPVFRLLAAPLHIITSQIRGARRYRYAALAPALASSGPPSADIAPRLGAYWTYTFNELMDDVLAPADGKRYVTVGELCTAAGAGRTSAKQEADASIEALVAALQPDDVQREKLDAFHQAWNAALDDLAASCTAADISAAPTDRLVATADYLSAMWRAAIHVHTPLENFYRSLSDEQKARLNGVSAPSPDNRNARSGDGAQRSPNWRACAETARVIPAWPTGRSEKQIEATAQQSAALATLRSASSKMAEFVAGSCPGKTPLTPLARLSAEENQLLTMIFAVQAITQPLAHFYDSLSDTQKSRFQASLQ